MATANPPAIQTLHYALFTDEIHHLEQDDSSELEHIAHLPDLPWIVDAGSPIVDVQYNLELDLYSFITSDGRAYAVKELSGASIRDVSHSLWSVMRRVTDAQNPSSSRSAVPRK